MSIPSSTTNLMMKDCGSRIYRVKIAHSEISAQHFVLFSTNLRFIFLFLVPASRDRNKTG